MGGLIKSVGLDKDRKLINGMGTIIKHLRFGASSACIHGSGQEVHAKRLDYAFSNYFSDVVKCEISQITDFSEWHLSRPNGLVLFVLSVLIKIYIIRDFILFFLASSVML